MDDSKNYNLNTFLILLIAIFFTDQFSKLIINAYQININNSLFSIFSWQDDEFFLNSITGLPRNVAKIFSGIICFYLSLLFFGLIYFIKNKNLYYIKIGFTIFFLSTISNFFDMSYKGTVTTFIHLKFINFSGNLADIFNNLSILILMYGIYFHRKELSGVESKRKTFLIDLDYQLKTALIIVGILIIQGLTFSIFSYFYFSNFTFNFNLGNSDNILIPYLLGAMVILVLFIGFCFLATVIYTQKTVGPLVAFERFIDEALAGKDAKLHMRDGDHLKALEKLSVKIKEGLAKHLPPPPPPPAL